MKTPKLLNYVADGWYGATTGLGDVASAVTGATVAQIGSDGVDFAGMARHARDVGGPKLRAMTFYERAKMLKALAEAVMARKEELYTPSAHTGATRNDGRVDIEGGAGTLFAYASKGRRELPNDTILLDGPVGTRRSAAPSSGSTSTRHCKASPFTSMRSTFRSGACWKSSGRRFSPAFPPS